MSRLTNYAGSRIFQFASDATGIPLDQFNFMICQLVAIISGLLFRSYLKPCPKNTLKRHLVTLLWGIALAHFCFGKSMWHMFFQAFVIYLSLEFCPRRYVHIFSIVFGMGYLSAVHIHRQIYDYGNYTLDISGPLMILTQKLTSLAFAFHDGSRPDSDLSPDQRSQAIRHTPHIIEFLSYVFNFQGVICGPLCFYQDYIDFIDGNNILKKKRKHQTEDDNNNIIVQPSIVQPVITKVFLTFFVAGVWFNVGTNYTIRSNMNPEILEKPMLYRLVYYFISAGAQRFKYYLAWVLSDVVANASGLGFNGYDEDDNPKWDLVTNVNIWKLETCTSMKSIFDNWNIQTQLWLRRIAYDRLPTGKTLGVFVLSAFWHGFYPGYYMTFVLAAFYVYAGRGIRRKIRPHFQANKATKVFYACITWLCTMFAIDYSVASQDLLEFWPSVRFYNTFYWFVHIIVIVLAVALPGASTKKRKPTDQKPEETTKQSEDKKAE